MLIDKSKESRQARGKSNARRGEARRYRGISSLERKREVFSGGTMAQVYRIASKNITTRPQITTGI